MYRFVIFSRNMLDGKNFDGNNGGGGDDVDDSGGGDIFRHRDTNDFFLKIFRLVCAKFATHIFTNVSNSVSKKRATSDNFCAVLVLLFVSN